MKNKNTSNKLYTERFWGLCSTFILDYVCIKYRDGNAEDIKEKEILEMKKNFKNIAIQTEDKIEIFCSKEEADVYNRLIRSDEKLMTLHLNGMISIFTK